MTQVIGTLNEMKTVRKGVLKDKSVGFVPTMGALHAGHAELLKRARQENDFVILSIFVNPTQFNNKEDLEKYPSTIDADLDLAQKQNVDCVWIPTYPQLYPDQYKYKTIESDFSRILCGAHRPGHFDGMLTVVMKLLNIIKPTRAYFGEKDYQQYWLVKGMVDAFFLDTQIVPVPTVREKTGLALSSRNVRLSPQEKEKAPFLYKVIKTATTADLAKVELEKNGFKVDYVEDVKGRRFAAAYLGQTRLIDNVEL